MPRERVRFLTQCPRSWPDFFTLLSERTWLDLEVLAWSEECGHYEPTGRKLQIQISSIGPLAKTKLIWAHANARGDSEHFDFISPYAQIFKFETDGTAELPQFIRLVKEEAAA